MIFLGILIGILLSIFIFILMRSFEKYEMGQIVFKSSVIGFDSFGSKKEEFYIHCVLVDGTKTLNYKLKVSKDVFDNYKNEDIFPIKK